MSTATPSKAILLVVFCVLVAAVAGVLSARYIFQPGGASAPDDVSVLEPARVLPELELIDGESKPFGLDRLRGQWSLLFFGFTHCPDICPNTLGILNAVHTSLKNNGDTPPLKIVFVSVDPRRDTPTALREYVRYFDEDFIGITGEIPQIRRLTEALYLPFAYDDNPDGSYTVEHSAALVLINPQAQARAYFTPPHAAQKLTEDITAVMNISK